MPKYLVSAGEAITFRRFTFREADVIELPEGLFETFTAAVQARLSVSVAAADLTVPDYYGPVIEEPSGRGWAVGADPLTLADVYDISADGGATALTSLTVDDGKITAEVAANGKSGLRLATYADSEDFTIAIMVNPKYSSLMSDPSHSLAVGLACALLADVGGGIYNPANDDWFGAMVRTTTGTTSTTINLATRTTDGSAWDGAETNSSAGTTYWNDGPYNFVLNRTGAALMGWIADEEGGLIHEVINQPAFGTGPCRAIARIDNDAATTGRSMLLYAVRTDLTISNGILVRP